MRSSVLALASVALVANAVAVSDVAQMKRNIVKRQSLTAAGTGDAVILNFALTLEHLEATFYSQALANFTAADFAKAGYTDVYEQIKQVSVDESTHVTFLTAALTAAGATPVQACQYKFPYTDVVSFLGLSQVLEGVGVSAYLGAAGAINNTGYLLAAGSILTVEARHNAFIRYLNGLQPAPTPFDTPASATAVVTLATPFFVSCPAGSAPTIKPFPSLATTGKAVLGASLAIAPTNASAVTLPAVSYCGYASGLNAIFSTYTNGSCMIPANVTASQTYVFLTSGPSISDATVLAGPAIIELGQILPAGGAAINAANSTAAATAASASGAASSGTATAAKSGSSMVKASVAGSVLAFAFALML